MQQGKTTWKGERRSCHGLASQRLNPNCERKIDNKHPQLARLRKILCPDGNRFLHLLRFACKERRKPTKPRKNKTPTSRQQQWSLKSLTSLIWATGSESSFNFLLPSSSPSSGENRRRTTQRLRLLVSSVILTSFAFLGKHGKRPDCFYCLRDMDKHLAWIPGPQSANGGIAGGDLFV
jgi:hypothetical protein